jgi:hypothetical protein
VPDLDMAGARGGLAPPRRRQPLLTEAAIAAVRQWAYTPTLLDGVPVAVVIPVTVRFALDEGRR